LQGRGIGADFRVISCDGDPCDIDYIHRRTPGADIYFVSNRSARWREIRCAFRVPNRAPELWLPDTGEIEPCRFDRDADGNTQVSLHLASHGSVFVVFRDATDALAPAEKADAVEESREIAGPWQVYFPPGWGAPATKTFDRLIFWTEVEDEGVKHFSGVASYRNEFDLAAAEMSTGDHVYLDLGHVRFVAEVYVNGRSAGILWKPPFRVDITAAVRPGRNELVVEVANTWSNRLVGDAQSSEDRDFCRTNIAKSLTWQVSWKETPLLESGLLGPVTLTMTRAEAGRPSP
jgi:hypothetical protein